VNPQEVIMRARQNALAVLAKIGDTYTVVSAEGATFSNAPKVQRKKVYNWADLHIPERLRNAMPGEVVEFIAGDLPLKFLQSRVAGECHKLFGSKNYVTEKDDKRGVVCAYVTGMTAGDQAELDKALDKVARA